MTNKSDDPFDLQRFVDAQQGVYEQALAELKQGHKRTHWSWFVLPQLRGLGSSPMAQRYAIGSLEEARAYLAHPLLGPRLVQCITAINAHAGTDAEDILGGIDARKFHSCATLFSVAGEPADPAFDAAIDIFFDGQRDQATLSLLSASAQAPGRPTKP